MNFDIRFTITGWEWSKEDLNFKQASLHNEYSSNFFIKWMDFFIISLCLTLWIPVWIRNHSSKMFWCFFIFFQRLHLDNLQSILNKMNEIIKWKGLWFFTWSYICSLIFVCELNENYIFYQTLNKEICVFMNVTKHGRRFDEHNILHDITKSMCVCVCDCVSTVYAVMLCVFVSKPMCHDS